MACPLATNQSQLWFLFQKAQNRKLVKNDERKQTGIKGRQFGDSRETGL